MELIYNIQNYEWGKRGLCSKVAILYNNINKKITIDSSTPYAELWLGTHVNAPSCLKDSEETLQSYISSHPESLGDEVLKHFGKNLPFLFKVLSVNKALSIQAHPSKKHAEELHATRPDLYKDPNHKPELAIALTKFEALTGFKPVHEIKQFVEDVPQLKNLIGNINKDSSDREFLQTSFRNVLTQPKEKLELELKSLLSACKNSKDKKLEFELLARLNEQFPNDVGCFMVFFLNYLSLNPGEAIFLAANEPHAYISGDCIECMACSDNVVRAGLTPKFIDVETLCSMLNYEGSPPDSKKFQPLKEDDYTKLYKPPVRDFAVAQIKIPKGAEKYDLLKRTCASVLLVVEGNGRTNSIDLKAGTAVFVPANSIISVYDIREGLEIYQALANV